MAGLQGVGKTTACGKLALYLKGQGKRVSMVATDVYRPAAIEQLVRRRSSHHPGAPRCSSSGMSGMPRCIGSVSGRCRCHGVDANALRFFATGEAG